MLEADEIVVEADAVDQCDDADAEKDETATHGVTPCKDFWWTE
jgi:hypothetical protein